MQHVSFLVSIMQNSITNRSLSAFLSTQGMKCIITYTASTESEDFYGEGADAKVPDLGSRKGTLGSIFDPIKENGVNAELLGGIKDPFPVAAN